MSIFLTHITGALQTILRWWWWWWLHWPTDSQLSFAQQRAGERNGLL